jgi:very-short-patch-repair endonuclease
MIDEEQVCADAAYLTIKGIALRHGTTERKVRGILKANNVVLDTTSSLERHWETAWRQYDWDNDPDDVPDYVTQYRVDPIRRWRLDVAWPEAKVAVELHGGNWIGGRHSRPRGIREDATKQNAAIERGWVVLVYTTDMLEDDPIMCIEQTLRVVRDRLGVFQSLDALPA